MAFGGARQRACQFDVECASVQEPGERVVTGGAGQFLLAQAGFGDVAHRADELAGPAELGNEADQRLQMTDLAVRADHPVAQLNGLPGFTRHHVLAFRAFAVLRVELRTPVVERNIAVDGGKPEYRVGACVPEAGPGFEIVVPDAGAARREREAKAGIDLGETVFGLLAARDVGLHADHARGLARCVPGDGAAAIENPDPVPVLVAQPHFGVDALGQPRDMPVAAGDGLLVIVRVKQLKPQIGIVRQFARFIAEHPRPARRIIAAAACKIGVPDAQPRAVDRVRPKVASRAIFLVFASHAPSRPHFPRGARWTIKPEENVKWRARPAVRRDRRRSRH